MRCEGLRELQDSLGMNELPVRLRFLHSYLSNQTGLLHMRWGAYRRLYMCDPRRRGLLSWGAGALFNILDQALLDSIVLSLVKLLDPAESRFQKNATFNRLTK